MSPEAPCAARRSWLAGGSTTPSQGSGPWPDDPVPNRVEGAVGPGGGTGLLNPFAATRERPVPVVDILDGPGPGVVEDMAAGRRAVDVPAALSVAVESEHGIAACRMAQIVAPPPPRTRPAPPRAGRRRPLRWRVSCGPRCGWAGAQAARAATARTMIAARMASPMALLTRPPCGPGP